jgi:hypothetical protein
MSGKFYLCDKETYAILVYDEIQRIRKDSTLSMMSLSTPSTPLSQFNYFKAMAADKYANATLGDYLYSGATDNLAKKNVGLMVSPSWRDRENILIVNHENIETVRGIFASIPPMQDGGKRKKSSKKSSKKNSKKNSKTGKISKKGSKNKK